MGLVGTPESASREVGYGHIMTWRSACLHTPHPAGERLAKRSDALSLRAMRMAGATPEELRSGWEDGGLPRGWWCGQASSDAFQAPGAAST